jgi:putative autotransporter adhesin-like protein
MRFSRAAVVLALFSSAALASSQDRDVPAFEEVHIASGIHATIAIGPRKPLHLEGDEAVLAQVETVVEDGALRVGFKRDSWFHGGTRAVKVTIQTPQLRGLGASGGSIVKAELTRSDHHDVQASGGSEVRVRGVDARDLSVQASGGSVLELIGRADTLDLQLSGGSHLYGHDLEVKDVAVQGSGGSQCELRATGKIRGGLSGGSELHVRGGAHARVATSGGSMVDVDN